MSRPLWARELKRDMATQMEVLQGSRPLWARELKREHHTPVWLYRPVAPPVGA